MKDLVVKRAGDGVLEVFLREVEKDRIVRFARLQSKRRLQHGGVNMARRERSPAVPLAAGADDLHIFIGESIPSAARPAAR